MDNPHIHTHNGIFKFIRQGGLAGLIFLLSCTSTTTIRAVDQGGVIAKDVKIYLDGSFAGRGEVIHSDTKIVGSQTTVNLRKEGCRTSNHFLSRTEKLSVGALAGGIFFMVPFLWIMGYNPLHSYEFHCDKY